MNDINNIDELLKESIGHFEQIPPPDAWSSIQQALPNTGAAGTGGAASKIATAVKSTSVFTKIILTIGASGLIAGSYVAYTYYANKTDEHINNSIVKEAQPPLRETIQSNITESNTQSVKPDTQLASPIKEDNTLAKKQISKNKNSTPVPEKTHVQVVTNENRKNETVDQPVKVNDAGKAEADVLITEQNPPVNQVKSTQLQAPTKPKPKPKHNFSTDNGEKKSATFMDDDQDIKPDIPNAITPNNDGSNDRFRIVIENEILYDLKIYDREGRLVFESTSRENTWDGTNYHSGEQCVAGTYQYIFRYQYANGKPHHISEKIVLLR